MKEYPAHIRQNGENGKCQQSVREHSETVGRYTAARLEPIGLSKSGELIGKLHDCGKTKEEFAQYLKQAAEDVNSVRRGSVNHTFAGCRYLLETFHKPEDPAAELLAYAIGAHHGLFDCVDPQRKNGFTHRLQKQNINYEESIQNYLSQCWNAGEIASLYQSSESELNKLFRRIAAIPSKDTDADSANCEILFYLGLLERLLLSSLIDADRRDSSEFITGQPFPVRTKDELNSIWADCLRFLENKLDNLPFDTPICRARREISDRCAANAQKSGGLIRLNVPTGGGKTLSSLRFALAHAKHCSKSRIILASSLLSVLDQNAKVIRDHIPDQSLIVEHHSNVVQPQPGDTDWERIAERWDSPILITTLVQLLNTLFSEKTTCIRRFSALIDSVIVIDEVQTVPLNMLTMFNLALNFLVKICNATVVLCSATQPYLEAAEHPLCETPFEMVPYDKQLWAVFQRTRIINAGSCRLEEIPSFAQKVLCSTDSLLLICNTKKEAEFVFHAMDGCVKFHLSASMCMAHRQDVLVQINKALNSNKTQKVVCVSTQVIEAGVDISFGGVIRLLSGMDSAVQAAGRCNRHGENPETAPVYLINCTDENLKYLNDIKRGKDATIALLQHQWDDLASLDAIKFYYHSLYSGLDRGAQDYQIDNVSIFDLLSENQKYAAESADPFFMKQAFQTAGKLFTVFGEDTVDVIVPYKDGHNICDQLYRLSHLKKWDFKQIDALTKQARPYAVSLYRNQYQAAEKLGAITELFDGRIRIMSDGFYLPDIGFTENQILLEV